MTEAIPTTREVLGLSINDIAHRLGQSCYPSSYRKITAVAASTDEKSIAIEAVNQISLLCSMAEVPDCPNLQQSR